MQITQEKYEKIAKYLPVQRGNVSMTNLQLINAILYVTENGCKWRALPESYGNWHTIYVRMNRWSKNGVLERVFAALQTEGVIQIKVEVVCLDSTSVKVHALSSILIFTILILLIHEHGIFLHLFVSSLISFIS